MSFNIFFNFNEDVMRLPVNPQEIKIDNPQANEKYEVLKLGQIALPTHMANRTIQFEAEFPSKTYHYVNNQRGFDKAGSFRNANGYLEILQEWRRNNKPIGFKVSDGINEEINTQILIESITITEKAGEEGDYYVDFKLIETVNLIRMEEVKEDPVTGTITKQQVKGNTESPKKPENYTIVKGDTLWGIAKRFLGDGARWIELHKLNATIKNPNLIYPGQVIKLR
ncbi:LysM peptidoglycan-binding domain-containing protein [Cellulosilyticum sp. I15G10I2]|uniref:LysM peptidoglycan-binding domain-containing protein n=1 Tax=Cellulosilyticum sp. I15G10I2 TaxID=1892843 RepID=UPI00085BC481|nr:LysM peptidoglycan-binding domain-containing protein [Cellulosilyticum sp. I15G10I2]